MRALLRSHFLTEAEMDKGGGYKLWSLYLQQAEREPLSQATRSFWLGKFLQSLPDGVLLSCREHIGNEKPHPTTEYAAVLSEQQPQTPITVVQQGETEEVALNEKGAATENTNNVVLQLTGVSKEPLWLHVKRADECLGRGTPSSSSSYLSPAVYRLVVESVVAADSLPLPGSILRSDTFTLDWGTLETFLGTDVICERGDYGKGAVRCAALARHVSRALLQLASPHHLMTLWSELFSWTGNQQLFAECVQLWLGSDQDSPGSEPTHYHHHISLLLCSTGLERALGDVYLSVSGALQCPSLLRDLLNTPQLEKTFGETVMCCLRCLIGPPSGLNLRNIFWHGFPSPGEISSHYVCLLLVVTASLGARLEASVEVAHRPPVSLRLEESIMTSTFPDLCEGDDIGCIERLCVASFFIPPSMLPLWLAGLSAFKQQQYHHSLVLLLPALEHALRRVFACINNCPHRVLTAESTTLYTTFDEILSPTLPDLSPNRLHREIGPAKLECLLDLLVQPEGPRLRDRISHGEVDLYSLSRSLANHMVSVCVLFCAQYSLETPLSSEPPIAKCLAVERSYESLFHPISLLKRELLQLTAHLETWSTIPLPPDWSHVTSHVTEPTLLSLAIQGVTDSFPSTATSSSGSLHQTLVQVRNLCHGAGIRETGVFSTAVRRLVEGVWRERREEEGRREGVSRSHFSKAGLELTGVLRRATENTANTLCQVRDTADLRHEQHQQKQLRSRQRKNYEHLLTSLPLYRAAVCLIIAMMAITVFHLHRLTSTDTTARKTRKFYRKVLQVTENLFSQTSACRNRWEEADQLALSLTQLNLSVILHTMNTSLPTEQHQ